MADKFSNIRKYLDKEKLSEDDFTQPGEMIPKDAGIMDFMKYNLAHRTPEQDAEMGMASGGLKDIKGLKFIPNMHIKSNAEEFSKAIQNAIESSPMHKQNITPYAEKDYKSFKTFLAPDGKSGFAIKPDGELVNVFSTEKGRGPEIVKDAVKQGASKLDAFNINNKLPELYEQGGFKTHKVEKNWEPGGPDVNYMAIPEKHPELFPKVSPEISANEQALNQISNKNQFGYSPERPIKSIPEAPTAEKTPVLATDPNINLQANANEQALKDMMNKQRMEKLNELTAPREFISEPEMQADELQRQVLSSKFRGGLPAPRPNYSITPEQIEENLKRLGKSRIE